MKGELCDEIMGLMYLLVPQFKVHKSIDTVNFKWAPRPVGRPRDIEGHCLGLCQGHLRRGPTMGRHKK